MVTPSSAKKRGRDAREAQILDAARALLETRGLVGSSIADVAVHAGVSEATVFNYFPTRRTLMYRVIGEWMAPVIDQLEVDTWALVGARARLLLFAERHLVEMAAAPGMHQLIYRELHWDNYYGSDLHRLNQRYTRIIGQIVESGQAAGDVRPDVDADLTRDMLLGCLHHVGWRTLMNRRPIDLAAVAARIVDQVVAGIIVREAA